MINSLQQFDLIYVMMSPSNPALGDTQSIVTLFFNNTGTPPQNITIQGAHSYSSGRFAGSVSAASNRYAWIKGADVFMSSTSTPGTTSITFSWTGANQLVLP